MRADAWRRTTRLHRSRDDKMLTGVSGGLAEYFDVDLAFVRISWVVFCFFTLGLALLLYVALAIVMPVADENGSDGPDESSGGNMTRPADRRGRLFAGGLLIVVGGLALLANLGLLSWLDRDVLWPLIPIAVGVAIILRRSRRA